MKQASLWCDQEELKGAELWDGLPQAVRMEFIELLVRIVVQSAIRSTGVEGKGGEHGLEGTAKPPRT